MKPSPSIATELEGVVAFAPVIMPGNTGQKDGNAEALPTKTGEESLHFLIFCFET